MKTKIVAPGSRQTEVATVVTHGGCRLKARKSKDDSDRKKKRLRNNAHLII